MTKLAVSAPLKYYFGDAAHQNAVDDVIAANLSGASPKSRRQRLPQDLSWRELEAAHNAALAALKIQVDFWSFLKAAWEATWGGLAAVHELKEVPPADYGVTNGVRVTNGVSSNIPTPHVTNGVSSNIPTPHGGHERGQF